jgi:DNA helicase II / ATP-dependent DNA helicase PcrA
MINEQATGTVDGIGKQDHSYCAEYWIVGPPGTGKTTTISRQVNRAAREFGSSAVLVTSFSRAAAAELADCDLPIPPDNLGTLHSHCFHALGRPQIAEAHVTEWNRLHPQLALTPVRGHARLDGEEALEEDPGNNQHAGDALLRELNRYRGLTIERERWPARLGEFEQRWSRYKRERRLLDFTDLIETSLVEIPLVPGNPAVIFVDEAQDLNVMQLRLVRKWGERAHYTLLAFDDDQTIHSFMGANPEAILDAGIPEDHKVILRQSHRVPRSIHELANGLVRRISRRQQKDHLPRNAEGSVHRLTGTYKSPEYAILSSAIKHIERGHSVMFLASCAYMLRPLIEVLRKNAIPFHNPYRKQNGFWNPLRIGPNSVTRRMLALLVAHPQYGEGQRQWTHHDVRLWTEFVGDGVLRPGARDSLAAADGRAAVTVAHLAELFAPEPLSSLLAALEGHWKALLNWWCAHIGSNYRNRIQFPASVVARRGTPALVEQPKITVGTIHSVKGGEADVVYLFPDLSRAGNEQYHNPGTSRDSILRVVYVGATRARETLYICQPAGAMALSF